MARGIVGRTKINLGGSLGVRQRYFGIDMVLFATTYITLSTLRMYMTPGETFRVLKRKEEGDHEDY